MAFVPKDRRLYVVCFCLREKTTRVISFRKANEKEVTSYGKIPDAAYCAANFDLRCGLQSDL